MREEERAKSRKVLEDFIVRNDIALIKAAFFWERCHRSREDDTMKLLPTRRDIPHYQRMQGTQLRGQWTDSAPKSGVRQLFAVSHAWLCAEHPDPSGCRLEALADDLTWLKASDGDLVFFDYCSLYQEEFLHPERVLQHPVLRSESERKLFQTAARYIDIIFSNPLVQVIIMPEIYDLGKTAQRLGSSLRLNRHQYIERGWCGAEFAIANKAERIASRSHPLFGRRVFSEDDFVRIEEVDFEANDVTIANLGACNGHYKQKQEFEGAPFFEQIEGPHFMYRKEERRWFVGPTLGAAVHQGVWAEFDTQDDHPPPCFWRVKRCKHPDIHAAFIKPGTAKMVVNGFAWLRSSANGLYGLQGDLNGRPYYSNEEGVFMYVLRNGLWCIAPVLGVIGDLVWAENKNSMERPPEGAWKVLDLVCPDILISTPPSVDYSIDGFGWVREKGNGPYREAGQLNNSPYYKNRDGTVYLYRWVEKRWRISPVLGATGGFVIDQLTSDALKPPTVGWRDAVVVIRPEIGLETAIVTGVRASRLPGKIRVLTSSDAETWVQACKVQEGAVEFDSPANTRYVRLVLDKDLTHVICIKDIGVAYRRSDNLEDRIDDYPGPGQGHRVPVQSRQGDWIKAEKGWLPLFVDGEKVFEGVTDVRDDAYSCVIVGYRSDEVRSPQGSTDAGITLNQFITLKTAGQLHFSRPSDADVALSAYRRFCEQDERRIAFATILNNDGFGAVSKIDTIRDSIDDPDGQIAKLAVKILAAFGERLYPQDIDSIASLLKSSDAYVREAAATALGKIGPRAVGYASGLATLLFDPDVGAQVASAAALAQIGPDPERGYQDVERAAEHIATMLEHPDRDKRMVACEALASMGEIGAKYADAVVDLLEDEFITVRLAAITSLGAMGPSGSRHAARLVRLLVDAHMRHHAIKALGTLGCNTEDVTGLLHSQEWYVRRDVLLAFAEFGADAVQYEDVVIPLLSDSHRDVRLAAIGALAAMLPSGLPLASEALRNTANCPVEDIDIKRAASVVVRAL